MQVGHGFEQFLVDIVLYLIGGAALFLFVQLLVYSTITVKNYKKRRNLIKKFPAWSDQLDNYLRKGNKRPRFYLRSDERKVFRDILISYYSGVPQDPNTEDIHLDRKITDGDMRRIRMLYRELGFVVEDLNQIKDSTWWSKTVALGRLSRLELNDAEDLAVDLMESNRKEVVISCISYLSSIKSRYLGEMIETVFQITDTGHFKELIAELIKAEVDPRQLNRLVDSPSIRARKAAASILGQKGVEGNTRVLKMLAIDPDMEVREETVKALGRIGSMKAAHILDTMSKDPDSEIRRIADREYRKIRKIQVVTSVWDLETDDRKTDDLISSFNRDSTMEDEGFSIMGF